LPAQGRRGCAKISERGRDRGEFRPRLSLQECRHDLRARVREPRACVTPPPGADVAAPTILVFDSGLGGLTVHRAVAQARPDARYVYAADDAFFPYGAHGEAELSARLVALMGELIGAHRPDLVVIACNTASTLVLPQLRARYSVP